jgi:hypothetical protein
MLSPKLLNGCSSCADILILIEEIDCKLAKLSGNLYNNLVFMLNKPVAASVFIDLLTYKRILQYKYINEDYASCYTVTQIASKVKLLKYKS